MFLKINKHDKDWKQEKLLFYIFQHFSIYEQLEFHAQLSWAWKRFYNLGDRPSITNLEEIGSVSL